MFAKLSVAAIALSLALPAFAGTTATNSTPPSATCSKSDASKFKPQSDLIALLKTQGLSVVKIKTEKGCYEAYTKDSKGKKATLGFNAETLEPVANAEAGEG